MTSLTKQTGGVLLPHSVPLTPPPLQEPPASPHPLDTAACACRGRKGWRSLEDISHHLERAMPSISAFLIAKVASKKTSALLRALHSTGVTWAAEEPPVCMALGEPDACVVLGWVNAPQRIFEFWGKDKRIRALCNQTPAQHGPTGTAASPADPGQSLATVNKLTLEAVSPEAPPL